jgi:hypothetical protein
MKTYLNVPYENKDEAKANGAKFDFDRKEWYTDNDSQILIEKFGKIEKGYNSKFWSRIESQSNQHHFDFNEFKRELLTKYEVVKEDNLQIPLFASVQETIYYCLSEGIIEEKNEISEPVFTEKEMKLYFVELCKENGISRNSFTSEQQTTILKAINSGLKSELIKALK